MSADNGYILRKGIILRKDIRGKFVLQTFFASADDYPAINRESALKFDTLEEAIDYYTEHDLLSEYDLHIRTSPVTPDPEEGLS